ncbi:MAG: hypothetical protein B7X90_06675 [Novosphingobium sp. 17-62-19]|nr:MAG: hypothetical protein B7X90_06675 [Novosphingobium sp. 17-62-19]
MGRLHKMEVAGLNIKIHPHPDGIYDDFILAIFGLKKITKIHGDRFGLITLVKQDSDNPEFYDGVLSTFLKIEMGSEWFNTETMEEATSNDVGEIKIPEYLHPNLKTFRFTFNTERHEFVFQHYAEGLKLTHNSALNYMKNIVTDNRIKSKFGEVKVGVINEKGSVDKIFSIPRITELELYIERPNSDVWGVDFEE